jgi:inorganic pyrophosphatase/exopolyphosphatase
MVEPRCTKQVIDHDQKRYGYARENAPVVAVVVTNAAAASARRDEAMHAMQTINFDKTNLHR